MKLRVKTDRVEFEHESARKPWKIQLDKPLYRAINRRVIAGLVAENAALRRGAARDDSLQATLRRIAARALERWA